jgi:hypothetical protein
MDAGYVAALSGLVGALIGSASSIATMAIQARMKDKRDRSKQLTDLSLAEFKAALDLATSGKGGRNVLPLPIYMYHNDLVLRALENGAYTPEKMQEISTAVSELVRVLDEDEKKQREQRAAARADLVRV